MNTVKRNGDFAAGCFHSKGVILKYSAVRREKQGNSYFDSC